MTTKLSLRLKLSDFINSEIESKIMDKINGRRMVIISP